jgi:hypothetical protein
MGREREGRVTEGVELNEVKHFYSWDTSRNPFEH